MVDKRIEKGNGRRLYVGHFSSISVSAPFDFVIHCRKRLWDFVAVVSNSCFFLFSSLGALVLLVFCCRL